MGKKDLYERSGKGLYPVVELTLGKIFSEIIKGNKSINFMKMIKNFGFIVKNVPFAEKYAIRQYDLVIKSAQKIGAVGYVGQAHLELGIIHKLKNRIDQATKHFEMAIPIFKETGAYMFLKEAEEALASVK